MTGGPEETLLERERELVQLDAALDGLADAGRLVVVEGRAGMGKSRLLAELRTRARARGLRTATARCAELEQAFAFGAVRQLFGPFVREADFAGAAGHARPLFDGTALPADSAGDAHFTRLHGLFWLCTELTAAGPLVLLIDDVQWADPGSVAFAAFLRARLADVPVLLAVSTRPVADPTPALADVLGDPAAVHVRPRPLSAAAVSRWAATALGGEPDPVFGAACHDMTGGTPLLLRELLAEAAAEGLEPDPSGAARLSALTPRGVASVVLLRLARLPAAAGELARAVAVLGDGAQPAEAGALAGLAEDDTYAAAELLVRADVLRDADRLAFTHPVVRAVVLDDLAAVVRPLRHREAARMLQARGAPGERVAAQLLAAGGASSADEVAPLVETARRAAALGDHVAASSFLRAALPATTGAERARLLLELAEAEARSGDTAAVDHLHEVPAVTEDQGLRTRAAVQLGRVLTFVGEPDRAIDVLEAAERAVPASSDDAGAVAAELIGAAHVRRSTSRRLDARLRALEEPAVGDHAPRARLTLAALGFRQAVDPGGTARAAARFAQRALAGDDLPTDPVLGGQVVVISGLVLTLAGRLGESDELFAAALASARSSGSPTGVAAFCAMRSLPLLRLGRLADAEAHAREALDLARVVGTTGTLSPCAMGVALAAALERGAAEDDLDALLASHPVDPEMLPASLVLLARGHIALAGGRPAEALEHFRACDAPDPRWGRDSPALLPWRSGAALALLALDGGAEAARLAAEEVALAEAFGLPAPYGSALRVAALTAAPRERGERLAAAVEVLEGAHAPLELARARADLGAQRRRENQRSAARVVLAQALSDAHALGAGRLAGTVRAELAALGVRPPRDVSLGRTLTPAEQRVVELAADGLMNREIAQRLFVTEKTVETHLRAAYRKLGVRGRRELPAAAARLSASG